METVDVLVRIPKNAYDYMMANPTRYNVCDDEKALYSHIKNGIVLPKRHEQAFILDKIKAEIFNACSDNYHMPVYKLSCEEIFEIIDKCRGDTDGRS